MRVLITRAAEAAAATAARLEALGHRAIVAPLFEISPLDWTPPQSEFDALMLTSAAAPRHAGTALERYRRLPCYCVGAATADAARAAGLDVRAAEVDDAAALLAHIARQGARRVLHLCGSDIIDVDVPAPLNVERHAVYVSRPRVWTAAQRTAAARADVALLYSPRAARHFGNAIGARAKRGLRVGALSAAVADAAGGGWAAITIAARPSEDALFAAAGLMCEKHAET